MEDTVFFIKNQMPINLFDVIHIKDMNSLKDDKLKTHNFAFKSPI